MASQQGSGGAGSSGAGHAAGSSGAADVSTTNISSSVPLSRNSRGAKLDVGWKYAVSIEGSKKVKCKFCQNSYTGGVFRLKHHLAQTRQNVEPCRAVPDAVRTEMWEVVTGLQVKLLKKSGMQLDEEDDTIGISKRKNPDIDVGENAKISIGNIFKKKPANQTTINNLFKKNIREDACQAIARFFYNNAISFNVARSKEFLEMCESIAQHGKGFKPPSYHDIRVKYLKQEVKNTIENIEEHKLVWKEGGCTIMTDGWTDKRRRTIINFLVNSPKGTVFLKSIDASHMSKTAENVFKMIDEVVEEVGEENVVQVVTDNAANYKAAGELLMEKRKKLYWTPCAAHCIDLMLEDFEKKLPTHADTIPKGRKITTYIYSRTALISLLQHHTKGKDLVRPGLTRFATSYLTLGCLLEHKGALIRMFTANEWKSSKFAKTNDGNFVEEVVLDKEFWKNVATCLKGAYPLIKVLRMVDSDEKPAMGYIYESMDQAKEKIREVFNGIKKYYEPLWNIIDERWDRQLHRPLHAAAYYLNPQLHYSPEFKADLEVRRGLLDCLSRMVPDIEEQAAIDIQLDDFRKKEKLFGMPVAKVTLHKKTPTDWWETYGVEHPELKKFAIRILSLTCSSSGCERNWSAFEMVHTKRRNRLKQKTMNDVVFVMANSKLAKRKKTRKAPELNINDLSSDDEWIVNNDGGDEELDVVDNLELQESNEEDTVEVNDQVGENVFENEAINMDDLDVEIGGDEDEDQMMDPFLHDDHVLSILD